jgi:hypothetical protein
MQMRCVWCLADAVLRLSSASHAGSVAHLPVEEAAMVLLALLDVTLGALSGCRGLHSTIEADVSAGVADGAVRACKAVKDLMAGHPELKSRIAAGLVEGGRLLHWFGCLQGMAEEAAVEVVSLLVAGVAADAATADLLAPGSSGLSPANASEVRPAYFRSHLGWLWKSIANRINCRLYIC